MKTKFFQMTIEERNDFGENLKHFHVIKTNCIEGLVNLFWYNCHKYKLGKHIKSARGWTKKSHIHRFERGFVIIRPLSVDEYIKEI